MRIDFHLNPHELANVESIVDRAVALYAEHDIKLDRMSLHMDLAACHNHAQKLDFGRLREFDDFNFVHDISGIINCLNRNTGALENCFLPRCSRPEVRT